MMENMLLFSSGLLSAVADFLGSEPIIYIVSFLLASLTIKLIKQIIT